MINNVLLNELNEYNYTDYTLNVKLTHKRYKFMLYYPSWKTSLSIKPEPKTISWFDTIYVYNSTEQQAMV